MSTTVETATEISQEVTTPIVEVEVEVDPMTRQLTSITELIETLAKTSKALTLEMKALTKDVNKLRVSKSAGGKKQKQKRVVDPDAPRKMGALEKPVPITEELCDFLGLTKGEMYSRQVITKSINQYVKDNDLQNPENRRYILLESETGLKLKALLRDPDQPLTFFNIQRYLKPHYPKSESETESKSPKGKTVDLTEAPAPAPVPAPDTEVSGVVADTDKVDETEADAPKKKIVRKVVRKTTTA